MSLYVYCICDESESEAFGGAGGLGGASVRALKFSRVAAVVGDVEDGERVAATGENVSAHNRVCSHALASVTPLPARFGTVVTEARLAEYIAASEAALVSALARVRGCVEMGVKVRDGSVKAKGKRQKAKEESDEAGDEARVEVARAGSGTAFLLAKRREILGDESSKLRAEELAAWLDRGLAGLVRESAVRLRPSESLAVRAAHLVERARAAEYKERVRELSGERPGLQFLTSGPWPPYSFSETEAR
ncbi:MAG TPA: GvpL/GvpF family gas vesicle protein [Pyrinomonadaceae bacterium]|nr:GvpL/GvpF family gas vesicle protein [Pyrinomonadaceae bacterium]